MTERQPLPDFERPPVSEVAMAVQFRPIAGWNPPHAGLFWSRIRDEYPRTESKLPLPSVIERYGPDSWSRPTVRLEPADPATAARFWFIGVNPTDLIQLQQGHFVVNWRKVRGDEAYPRYARSVRPRFVREWNRFREFLKSEALSDNPDVQQCELTYVNDIPQGELWNEISEVVRILAPWSGLRTEAFLPAWESLNITGAFVMPNDRGRLHFSAQHVKRNLDDTEVVQLRLTARGQPESGSDADILSWFDAAREWIVRGFASLTTPEAHRIWGRKP